MLLDESVPVAHLTPGCLGPPHIVAGWYRQYTYDLSALGQENGHGELTTYVVTSPAEAATEQAGTGTLAYSTCFMNQVSSGLSTRSNFEVTGPTTQSPEVLSSDASTNAVVYATPYRYAGQDKVDYDTVVWLQHGRYRAVLELHTCCAQPPASEIQPDAQLIATRMRAQAP